MNKNMTVNRHDLTPLRDGRRLLSTGISILLSVSTVLAAIPQNETIIHAADMNDMLIEDFSGGNSEPVITECFDADTPDETDIVCKKTMAVNNGRVSAVKGKQDGSVYFGQYLQSKKDGEFIMEPIKWRVLDNPGGKLFLLADKALDFKSYNVVNPYRPPITWGDCTLHTWLNDPDPEDDYSESPFYAKAFNDQEKDVIATTRVENPDFVDDYESGGTDTYDSIFLLSVPEVINPDYGFNFKQNVEDEARIVSFTDYAKEQGAYGDSISEWWLRSPAWYDDYDGTYAANVTSGGTVSTGGDPVDSGLCVLPALNIDLASVILTSAAAGGKDPGDGGAGKLKKIDEYTDGSEWKLTIHDKARDAFTALAAEGAVLKKDAGYTGWTVPVVYSGAAAGEDNEHVSAILTDSRGNALYYGHIATNKAASGEKGDSVTIPTGLTAGTYYLKVFNEQVNGDKETDLSSPLREIRLTVEPGNCTITFRPNGGSGRMAAQTVVKGKETKLNANTFTYSGYDFKSWNTKADGKGTGYKNKADITADDDLTLYAQWKKKTYKIDVKTDGHGTAKAKPEKAVFGTKIALTAKPAAGYKFKKWTGTKGVDFKKATSAKTSFKMPKKNVTVKANFEEISGLPFATIVSDSKSKIKLNLTWKKVKEADGYDVFFERCNGKNEDIRPKLIKTIKNNETTEYSVSKLGKDKLKKASSYKACVKAFVWKNKKKTGKIYIGESPLMHAYTSGGTKKNANAKSVTVKKPEVTIKKGKTSQIKTTVKSSVKGKEVMPSTHVATVRYLSTDKKIATVDANGVITAKEKGECTVYAFAHNGVYATVTVTVK